MLHLVRRSAAAALATVAVSATLLGVAAQDTMTLNGAGSSADNPLFSRAFSEYTKTEPGVQVNYQSVGSGAGIEQLTNQTVDFGATDAPMTDEQLTAAGGADAVVHVPVTIFATAVTYNLPGLDQPLQLDGDTIGGIFLGDITSWNDDKIAALNEGVDLPDTAISVVHRSDGSGTTNIFTTYLASVSQDWQDQVGAGLSVDWPVGIGAKGSEGVTAQVDQIEGGVTYVEYSYAAENDLPGASIMNSAGEFVQPGAEGATACANAAAPQMPEDLRVMIAGCTGDDAAIYPISGFSWVVLYTEQADAARGQALVDLLDWLIHDGQQYGQDLYYAPLPDRVVERASDRLSQVTANGEALMTVSPMAATPAA